MTRKELSPPRLALWWLRHMCLDDNNEALTGDLIERFQEGRTRGWFWRQVFIVWTYKVWGAIWRRWSFFFYAAAGAVAMSLFSYDHTLGKVSAWLDWSELPWPWSQIAFELSSPAIVTLATLPILALGLVIEHSFRWAYIFRTWFINFLLIALDHYSIDLFPGLLRSIPGDPYHKILVIPGVVQVLLLASTFLVAAWLGCPMTGRVDRSEKLTAY